MKDFLPQALGDFVRWVQLQTAKRPAHAAALGYSAPDVSQRDAADAAVLAKIATAETAIRTARAAVAERDAAIDTYETSIRADIARAKTSPAYTEAIGQDCQWLGTSAAAERAATATTELKPTLRQRPSAEGIRLDWSKDGQDGVRVYRRVAGSPDWGRPLAFDSRSPYIDTETGLRGTVEYCVQLMKDDKPVGERSDVVVVRLG